MVVDIPAAKDSAKHKITELVEGFSAHKPEYESSGYLERQLQTDFLDEMFKALGWDVTNKRRLSPLQREVLVEKGDTKGRPDYSFRINGEDRFFVEAKAPSNGTNKPEDIFQAKRYGWNTRKVNIAVLTDFKSFKVFDASLKPQLAQPRVGLLFELEFSKFTTTDFEKLWLFSQEQVASGSLDLLGLKDASSKRLRVPVDTAFLEQMTEWRERLAKDIYKNNPALEVRGLNDVVQKLLDRLVFVRILEDRKIIESKSLKEIMESWGEAKHRDIQPQLNALFKQLNNDFNGEIFKDHPCERAKYDSKVIAEIISELYYPKSPYDFSVIGVELLGVIYEKYLGKTIHMTEKRIKVEEKPEVRKAGGVFYTPKYIVENIVNSTVGKLVEDKTPDEIAKLRVLDPACGSGSFLIGALDCLFQYHLKYYIEHQKDAKSGTLFPNLIVERDSDGNEMHRLSIEKKGEILRNNIYGVDIDQQAVEITMMSLYIKALEGEKTLPHNKELLPSLSNNIKCGNSLIETDFFEQKTLLGDEIRYHVNAFNWGSRKDGFGDILENEKFSAIIGNPPYIRIQTLNETAPEQVEYFSKKYQCGKSGNYDIYVLFVEKAINLLSKNGKFGFILPHKFFQAEYGRNLRKLICEQKLLEQIVSFGDQQVFEGASTYTCLLFLSFKHGDTMKFAEISSLENIGAVLREINNPNQGSGKNFEVMQIRSDGLSDEPWHFRSGAYIQIFEKLNSNKPKLTEICEKMFQGLATSADGIYVLKLKKRLSSSLLEVHSPHADKTYKMETAILRKYIKGKEIKPFFTQADEKYLLFPYTQKEKAELIPEEILKKEYPHAYDYLQEFRVYLSNREHGKMKGSKWYAFTYPKSMLDYERPKIMTPTNAFKNSFYFDEKEGFYLTAGVAGGFGLILEKEHSEMYSALTAILNSKLMEFWVKNTSTALRGGYFSFEYRFIKDIPIILPANDNQKRIYSGLKELSQKIAAMRCVQGQTSDPHKKDLLDREANSYLEKIDQLVYELYGLTEEEKKIVEEAVR